MYIYSFIYLFIWHLSYALPGISKLKLLADEWLETWEDLGLRGLTTTYFRGIVGKVSPFNYYPRSRPCLFDSVKQLLSLLEIAKNYCRVKCCRYCLGLVRLALFLFVLFNIEAFAVSLGYGTSCETSQHLLSKTGKVDIFSENR